tara:strand:- start:1465 stop:1620 length:156 start_codon:yes stop_codon:yes gene_type:complete
MNLKEVDDLILFLENENLESNVSLIKFYNKKRDDLLSEITKKVLFELAKIL